MTRLSEAELVALGFDPTPGDPDAFALTVDTVRGAGKTFAEISLALHGTSEETAWRGQAATGFRALVADDFRPLVDTAAQSLTATARALAGWVEFMRLAQASTRRLADAAVGAASAVQRAEPGNASATAQQALDAIRADAARHSQAYETEQAAVARAVAHATADAPNKPGLWDRISDAAGGLLESLRSVSSTITSAATDLATAVAPVAQLIGDLSAAVGAVCGVLAFVPGLQALGAVAVALAAVALLTHYVAMVGSTGSFVEPFSNRKMLSTLAVDGVGLVAGVAAFRAGKAVENIVRTTQQPVRTVAKFGIGQRGFGSTEIPEGLFGLATRGPYSMGQAEFGHRLVQFRGDVVGLGVSALESPNHRDTFAQLGRLANPASTPLPSPSSPRPITSPGAS